MSTSLQQTPKRRGLTEWVQEQDAIAKVEAALCGVMQVDQFIQHMLVAFADDKIRPCTEESKYKSLLQCAASGMVPTTNQVSLIARKKNKNKPNETLECTTMIQWQGMKALMERHPNILEVTAELVHVADECVVSQGQPEHTYDPFNPKRVFASSKDLRGGYLKIIYTDGRPPKYHFVPKVKIDEAQRCAQTQDIWRAWYYEMALKTIYRNGYARRAVPMDPMVAAQFDRVVNIDDVNLGNDPRRNAPGFTRHIEQARLEHDAVDVEVEPADEPPAAEDSQVDPDVDDTDGVDEPPEPTSAEQRQYYETQIGTATALPRLTTICDAIDADPWISQEDKVAVLKQVEGQRVIIRSADAAKSKRKGKSKEV